MAGRIRWREYAVPLQGIHQQMGEMIFFADGAVQLGNRVFLPNALIDNFSFAAGHIARRRLDTADQLEVLAPDGEHYYFRYGWFTRAWYRRIKEKAAVHSRLKQHCIKFGPGIGPATWIATEATSSLTKMAIRLMYALLLGLLPVVIVAAVIWIFVR